MIILVVEDEYKIASFIKKGLEMDHYTVEVAAEGKEALEKIIVNEYDLVILDIMLPDIDGFKVCEKIREQKINTPILILTAKDTVDDRVKGLDSGADDYLIKPFAFEELSARIRSLLRREKSAPRAKLQVENLVLDPATHEVTRGVQAIDLTSKEYRLLDYLMRHLNYVCTRTMIAEHIWGYNFNPASNIIDVYMNRLRQKVDNNHHKKLIHTIRNVGYKIKE